MKILKLSLFKKFAIVATFVVLVFGVINLFFLWNSTYKSFEKEIDKRSKVLSRIISERALQPVVYDDFISVYKVLDEIKTSDPSIAYIFILDNKYNILAQTFSTPIPSSLLKANKLENGKFNIVVIEAKNFKHEMVRDIAYPILNGDIGTVRLGLIEDDIRKELNVASRTLLLMILLFLTIGLFGAFYFSYLITSPIKIISKKAQLINLNYIEKEDFIIDPLQYKTLANHYFSDELDTLVSKFSEMMQRLKINVLELQNTRDSFIQAEKLASIGTLTAGISHEINNPLAGIKNCMRRIEKNPENLAQNLKYIELIKDAIDKIENVVRPLLDFSRKQDLNIDTLHPGKIVEDAILLTSYKIKKSTILLVKEFEENLSISVSPNHLVQVIVNLILNGIDAIDAVKKNNADFVGILKFIIKRKDDKVQIIVKDNGLGIPENIQSKIFDPFFTSKEIGKGTGLGLYVSFNIVKELKGNLFFNSTFNRGTEFIIEFPKP